MKPPRLASRTIRLELLPSVNRHTSPALKSREQTCAMKEDSSGPSDVVLDGSYKLRVFCHILVIASRTDFYRA